MSERPGDLLLALETSGDVCSVAILRDGQFVAEQTFRHGMHLSERLMAHFDAVLRDADAAFADVTALAVGIGPGSFTGTRIGVMTLKTLAAVQNLPLYGIGSMDALAQAYAGLRETVVVPLLPCRAEIVFACPFRPDGPIPEPLVAPDAVSLPELIALLSSLPARSLLFCGPSAARFAPALTDALGEQFTVSFGRADFARAADTAALASHRRANNIPTDDPFALVPLYIAPPPISLPKM